MFGICAYGAYVPAYRLSRDEMARAHGGRSLKGERAVANYDEDTLTMAAEAITNCLGQYASVSEHRIEDKITGLFLATTTPPLAEKQAAGILAALNGISPQAYSGDVTGSLRGALSSLRLGASLLRNDEDKVLVAASDMRLGEPGSENEQAFGDGAAAFLLGQEHIMAVIEAQFVVNSNFNHFWRRANEDFVHSGDARFVEKYGYERLLGEAIRGLLEGSGLSAKDISRLVMYSPDGRAHRKLAQKLGFDSKRQVADTLFSEIGDSGTAQVCLTLIKVLEEAQPGEKIIVAAYGDGSESLLLTVTEEVTKGREVMNKSGEEITNGREEVSKGRETVTEGQEEKINHPSKSSLAAYLARRRTLPSYHKYLRFREVLGESTYVPFSSLAILWREEEQNLHLLAGKCRHCGAISFPQRRVCDKCGAIDEFDAFPFARTGRVYTYTNDHVYLNPTPPLTQAVVDLDGGGRFFAQVTDADPKDIRIGIEVELVLRKLHDGQELPNYFWKARPLVGSD